MPSRRQAKGRSASPTKPAATPSKALPSSEALTAAATGSGATPAKKAPRKRRNKPTEGQVAQKEQEAEQQSKYEGLECTPLVEGSASTHPAVFTRDNDYYFLATGSSVKIHSRLTGEVVSTLSARDPGSQGTTQSKRLDVVHTAKITGIALHPLNQLQLITASLDGTVKVWDFLDGALLASYDVGFPVSHLAVHEGLGSIFVAITKPKSSEPGKTDPFNYSGRTNSIIYMLNLQEQRIADSSELGKTGTLKARDLLRVGKTREAAGLQVSPDGRFLVAIGNSKVQVAQLDSIKKGFSKYAADDRLTCLAFHPHDGTFATGDVTGKIRVWYALKLESAERARGEQSAPNTLLHWHAHAVSGLAYAPNGAYLISGGEESVLVLWQLHTGQREYIPRLGAPIASVACAGGFEGRELEYAVGLTDGSITFISSINLKPMRSFVRVRIDSTRALLSPYQLSNTPAPLCIQPATQQLVIAAGHPSSLQFFDAANDRHVAEVEVTPSNRVSRPDEAVLEPTRVERVCFGGPNSGSARGSEWMATFERRLAHGAGSAERVLKFWRWDASLGRYALNTRIEAPHGEALLSSMSFRPVSGKLRAPDEAPLFVTTALDGKCKTWRCVTQKVKGAQTQTFWVARSVFGYRDTVPLDSAWSADGSLLAVAQGTFVTVWEPESNTLQAALACPELRGAQKVLFAGKGGRFLVSAGAKTLVVWDLVRAAVHWQRSSEYAVDHLFVAQHVPDGFVTVSHNAPLRPGLRTRALVQIFNPLSSAPLSTYELPFAVRSLAPLPASADVATPSFYALTETLDVVSVGTAPTPQASSSTQSLRGVRIARRTLFDDLFGQTQIDEQLDVPAAQTSSDKKGVFALFDAPPHLMPPLSSLVGAYIDVLLPKRAEPRREEKAEEAEQSEEMDEVMQSEETQTEVLPTDDDVAFITDLFKQHVSTATPAVRAKPNGIHPSPAPATNGTLTPKGLKARASNGRLAANGAAAADSAASTPVSVGKKRKGGAA